MTSRASCRLPLVGLEDVGWVKSPEAAIEVRGDVGWGGRNRSPGNPRGKGKHNYHEGQRHMHTRGPWVPVKLECLCGLVEPSTLGGQANLSYSVPRDGGGGMCSPSLAFLLPQSDLLPEDQAGMGLSPELLSFYGSP